MQERIERIKKFLEEKKAEDVQIFDLKDKGYFVDTVIIATSLGDKHTAALLDYLKEKLKPLGEEFLKIDESDEWIVIDLGDILIHIMTEAYRKKYNIEEFLEAIKEGREIKE
ncbi:ribosome silencing factor [Nitrosophilus alvini]|uniref:ribosome silencing factor n=1 Tax=Nitrosophilus alvini TaxID=2714855 RepID=UPI001909C80C|nr:ribosome silencing factor [Nitrosophilus alvini]